MDGKPGRDAWRNKRDCATASDARPHYTYGCPPSNACPPARDQKLPVKSVSISTFGASSPIMCGHSAFVIHHLGYGPLDMITRIPTEAGDGSASAASKTDAHGLGTSQKKAFRTRKIICSRITEYALRPRQRNRQHRRKQRSRRVKTKGPLASTASTSNVCCSNGSSRRTSRSASITDANITRSTIRRKVLAAYETHKEEVMAVLRQSCGLIHVSFDGWKSGNRYTLYGITCFFRDESSQPRKLVLGVPELRTRHFGHNVAAEILDVLDAYGIRDRIGYFTLDNLGFAASRRRGRCFGHTLNLSAEALLFGHEVKAFEEQLSGAAALSEPPPAACQGFWDMKYMHADHEKRVCKLLDGLSPFYKAWHLAIPRRRRERTFQSCKHMDTGIGPTLSDVSEFAEPAENAWRILILFRRAAMSSSEMRAENWHTGTAVTRTEKVDRKPRNERCIVRGDVF
ncbi:restless-like transposase [Purpureocillium lilacinum]|uniref:Restless-like transposase n=1 Tax=Purpureocillium lilacinum TaxID=33203 RepID=A0A179F6A0_PURLI|nr:restless-like transposase [Purpureocillium lilacinum]